MSEVGRQHTHITLDKDPGASKTKYSVTYAADLGPHLAAAKLDREKELTLKANKRSEFKKVASIDFTLAMKIRAETGVDPLNLRTPADTRKYLQILQTQYPHLLTTNKKVWRPTAPKKGAGRFANIPAECLR
jgi:hypothetical protein